MNQDFVTVQTFSNPVLAHMVRNRLEEEGVRAFLANEALVSTVWHLSNAIGGIRLQVAAADAERAAALLAEAPLAQAGEELQASAGMEETEPSATPREELADRALGIAFIGILLFPLQAYAAWLLWKVVRSPEQLRGEHRVNAVVAGAIALSFLGILAVWLATLMD